MKKLKITALLAVLAFSPFYAGVFPADSNPVVKVLADAIKWKSESIDVGNIPQGKPKVIRFEFTNTSKKPIVIENVAPSCGCTTADYTKTPILPGKKGFVEASYNAASAGPFMKTVNVTTSDSKTPKTLSFKGTVVAS
ncbi:MULTISPECIES: DUF1573 domain-containing protein [Chryseobacterium]|jgi:hypothetical protein|uniref:DUF1573 domain-containing protein n=1 Tax=Chryseobacterium nepalense TaxID=1854498 RepID=A0ABY4K2Y7_9FLAO|nr:MULTISPECIES: DUF1573 domain-containing protein [Chryseobacterium]MEA1849734.1 DUF1573 domain-containing protein [Chryseobacterium sp. MHB01]MEC5172318.1 hypothetical protein [Chryseobacterium nepalense]UPQ75109.1 DUF1573 domain-containing protein [Chryseobacterium nepalense]